MVPRLEVHGGPQVAPRGFVVSQLQKGVPPQAMEGPVSRGLGDRPGKSFDGGIRSLLAKENAPHGVIQAGIERPRTGGLGRQQHPLGALEQFRSLGVVPLLPLELLRLCEEDPAKQVGEAVIPGVLPHPGLADPGRLGEPPLPEQFQGPRVTAVTPLSGIARIDVSGVEQEGQNGDGEPVRSHVKCRSASTPRVLRCFSRLCP